MSERRRAKLDGARSGLDAAEGGTISGRRPMSVRRLLVLASVTCALASTTVGLTATPADAVAPRDQGWWTVTNPLPPAPDVPGRGLLIQAGPGGTPTAFAAVLYELEPGATAGSMTFTIAPNTLTTPSASLQVCPLLQPIVHPEQGGPMSNAPPYDCSRKAVVPAEANSFKFPVANLASDRLVALALLPNGPVDRIVLNAPDENSLSVQGAPLESGAAGVDAGAFAPVDAAPAPADLGGGFTNTGGAPDVSVPLPAVSAGGPSSVAPAPAATPRAPSTAATPFRLPASTAPEDATPLLVVLLILGALGAAALWYYAGRQQGGDAAPISDPSPAPG